MLCKGRISEQEERGSLSPTEKSTLQIQAEGRVAMFPTEPGHPLLARSPALDSQQETEMEQPQKGPLAPPCASGALGADLGPKDHKWQNGFGAKSLGVEPRAVVPGHPQPCQGTFPGAGSAVACSDPRVAPAGVWGQRGRRAEVVTVPQGALGTCSPRAREK